MDTSEMNSERKKTERNCLAGPERKRAEDLLSDVIEDGRLEFICSNEDRDFVENCRKCLHLHWPLFWLDRLNDIRGKLT